MKNSALQVMDVLNTSIPVEWDRFTKTDDGFFVVYGWILRSDGQRDFVIFEIWDGDNLGDVFCTTSSAKYSEQICTLLYGSAEDHNPCRKINELYVDENNQPIPTLRDAASAGHQAVGNALLGA